MYRSQKNQPLKKRNTYPKNTDARKEIEAEEKEAKKDPGEKFIDMLLKTGNENVNKEFFGNQNGQGEEEEEDLFGFFKEEPKEKVNPSVPKKDMQEKAVEEEEEDLFGFFKEEPKEKVKPSVPETGMREKAAEEEEEDLFDFFKEDPKENKKPAVSKIEGMQEKDVEEGNIFDLSNDNIIEQKNEIINTASKKNTDRKNRRQTFIQAKDRPYRSFMRIRSRKRRSRPVGTALKIYSKNQIRLPLI